MSEPGAGEESGQPHALRDLLTTALDAFRTRVDLAAVELEIHLLALARMLVWVIGGLVCVLLAVAFGITAIIAAFWDTHRLLGLLSAGLLFIVLAALCGLIGVRAFRGQPAFFSGTLRQLDEDTRSLGAGR